jgi:hypothetical protein
MFTMTNAKIEFMRMVETEATKVKCVWIMTENRGRVWSEEGSWGWSEEDIAPSAIILKEGYTEEEYNDFLSKLDFEYDSGYGIQVLDGTIWMQDGTWFDRGEYDGSEWWAKRECPPIPQILKRS